MTKLVLKTTRYIGHHAFFVKKFKKMKKIVKIVAFRGNSGNSGGDGVWDGLLNFNHRGTGRGKMGGELEEWVPWVPLGIPTSKGYVLSYRS